MRREAAIIAGAVMLVILVAVGAYAFLKEDRGTEKRGSAKQEFDTTQEPETPRKPKATIPWPTYAFDNQRTHLATGFKHRPPYRKVWRLDGKDTLEFPPIGGLRARVPRPAEGPVLRHRRQDGQGPLEAQLQALRGLLARGRARGPSTRPTWTSPTARRDAAGRRGSSSP